MKNIINDYIEQNRLCAEYIFEDYKEFLEVLFSNGGRVSTIVWFDYCRIENQSESLGSGGYVDIRNATFMWAETQIYESGFENKALIEILEYIEEILQKYPEHRLYPAFYLTDATI